MSTAALPRDALMPRQPAGMGAGLLLALLAHGLLVAALAFSVRWNTSNPAGVEAELWAAVPQIAAPRAAAPEPVPVPPEVKPPPPTPPPTAPPVPPPPPVTPPPVPPPVPLPPPSPPPVEVPTAQVRSTQTWPEGQLSLLEHGAPVTTGRQEASSTARGEKRRRFFIHFSMKKRTTAVAAATPATPYAMFAPVAIPVKNKKNPANREQQPEGKSMLRRREESLKAAHRKHPGRPRTRFFQRSNVFVTDSQSPSTIVFICVPQSRVRSFG